MKRADLMGKTFHKLTVIQYARNDKNGHSQWWVVCSCNRKEKFCVSGDNLVRGRARQCKLCRFEEVGKKNKKNEEDKLPQLLRKKQTCLF